MVPGELLHPAIEEDIIRPAVADMGKRHLGAERDDGCQGGPAARSALVIFRCASWMPVRMISCKDSSGGEGSLPYRGVNNLSIRKAAHRAHGSLTGHFSMAVAAHPICDDEDTKGQRGGRCTDQ